MYTPPLHTTDPSYLHSVLVQSSLLLDVRLHPQLLIHGLLALIPSFNNEFLRLDSQCPRLGAGASLTLLGSSVNPSL